MSALHPSYIGDPETVDSVISRARQFYRENRLWHFLPHTFSVVFTALTIVLMIWPEFAHQLVLIMGGAFVALFCLFAFFSVVSRNASLDMEALSILTQYPFNAEGSAYLQKVCATGQTLRVCHLHNALRLHRKAELARQARLAEGYTILAQEMALDRFVSSRD